MSRYLGSAPRVGVTLLVLSTAGFLIAGMLATRSKVFGIDFSSFDQDAALLFLGALAQLVLAFAVWFQIQAADGALQDRVREHRLDALLTFVGQCANASSLYHQSAAPLDEMVDLRGGHAPEVAVRAQREMDLAENPRQAAYAALFRVEAIFGRHSTEWKNADQFMSRVSAQRRAARQVWEWATSPPEDHVPAPDVNRVWRATDTERTACVDDACVLAAEFERLSKR